MLKKPMYQRIIEALLATMLALMTVLVFVNAVLRKLSDTNITTSEELARFMFVWLTFIGAILAMREGTHLGVDTLVRRLGRRGAQWLFGISHVLMLICCGFLALGAYKQTLINWGNVAPVTGISMTTYYGIGVVGAVGMAVVIVWNLYRLFTGQLSDQALINVADSEETIHTAPAADTAKAGDTK